MRGHRGSQPAGRGGALSGWFLVALLFALPLIGCASRIRVKRVEAAPVEAEAGIQAGAAEVDLTPPLGAPLWGYAIGSAAAKAQGYRTRLMARTIVLQGQEGGRFALIQCDMGSISHLLHHRVAERVASLGISADRLLIAASHTHAGPGGYFGNTFYNFFGAGKPGFDQQVLDFLTTKITNSIEISVAQMGPAAVSFGTTRLPGITYNRSFPAWESNLEDQIGDEFLPHVDDRLYLLRVDRALGNGTQPLAAFAVFAVHGTTVSMRNDLYHGDVHGYAARQFAGRVRSRTPELRQGFVAAFADGAVGDASAIKDNQGFATSERVGSVMGDAAFRLFSELGSSLRSDLDLSHAYREQPMSGAMTSQGDLCSQPNIGMATLAGAEDGPSDMLGMFGIREGQRKAEPQGCHSYKVKALGLLQAFAIRSFKSSTDFGTVPNLAPFQTLMIHPRGGEGESEQSEAADNPIVVFGTVPGEPTAVVGERIATRMAGVFGDDYPRERVAVVGLANSYLGYFTTPAEYRAQHYEGGATFYGPLQSILAIEQLTAITERSRDEVLRRAGRQLGTSSARVLDYDSISFRPGERKDFLGTDLDCARDATRWKAGETPTVTAAGDYLRVEYEWTGLARGVACPPPQLRILCAGSPLLDRFGQEETDAGTRFEVRRLPARTREDQWRVSFFAHPSHVGRSQCRFEVERPGHVPLSSPAFDLVEHAENTEGRK